jgi:hypothetical protein
MSTREPGLQEVLVSSFDYLTAGMYTTMPGIILTVYDDLGQQRIDVQPTINIRSEDGEDVSERSPVLNVPLQLPFSKVGGLSFPVSVGDPVLLHFSMRGLELWKRGNGYPSTPNDLRKFDKRDCIASPGVFPFPESPNQASKHTLPHSPKDVVLVHNRGTGREVEIRLTESGDVRIKSVSGTIYLDSPLVANEGAIINKGTLMNGGSIVNGLAKMNNGAQIAQTLNVSQGVNIDGIAFATHRHTGVDGGNDTSGGPVN